MAEALPENRLVGGLWCSDVLAALPDYLEGSLPAPVRAAAEAHLRGCDTCARFGGQYAATIAALQRALAGSDVPGDVAARLAARLARSER